MSNAETIRVCIGNSHFEGCFHTARRGSWHVHRGGGKEHPMTPSDPTATAREVIEEVLGHPDHAECRANGPDAEADCLVEGLSDRGFVVRSAALPTTPSDRRPGGPCEVCGLGADASEADVLLAHEKVAPHDPE